MELVLSLFPGAGILDRGFTAEGFCITKGPDIIWDERIEDYHIPPGRFDGIIGGQPCQNYSMANRKRDPAEGDRLVKEMLRIIHEGKPTWFLIENVPGIPNVASHGYTVQRLDLIDCECGGTQTRLRHIQFGSRWGSIIRPIRTPRPRRVTPTLTTVDDSPHARHSRRVRAQGLDTLPLRALTRTARSRAIGNAVPFTMATTLARAVALRGPVTPTDCPCLCGRVTTHGTQATAACRKRMQRRRQNHSRQITWP